MVAIAPLPAARLLPASHPHRRPPSLTHPTHTRAQARNDALILALVLGAVAAFAVATGSDAALLFAPLLMYRAGHLLPSAVQLGLAALDGRLPTCACCCRRQSPPPPALPPSLLHVSSADGLPMAAVVGRVLDQLGHAGCLGLLLAHFFRAAAAPASSSGGGGGSAGMPPEPNGWSFLSPGGGTLMSQLALLPLVVGALAEAAWYAALYRREARRAAAAAAAAADGSKSSDGASASASSTESTASATGSAEAAAAAAPSRRLARVLLPAADGPASPWLAIVAMRGLPWLGSVVTLAVCGPLLLPPGGPDYVAVGATLTAAAVAVAAACALGSLALLVDTARLVAALPRGVLCACRRRRTAATSRGGGSGSGGGGIMADFVDARTMQRDAALPVVGHGLLLGCSLAALAGCVAWLLLRALVVVAATAASAGAPYLPLLPPALFDGGDPDLARPPPPYPSWVAYATPPWAATVLVCALAVTAVADGTVPRLRRAAAVFRLRWQMTSLLALLGPVPTALLRVDDASSVRYRPLDDDEAALLAAAMVAQQAEAARAASGWRPNPLLGGAQAQLAQPTLTPLKLAASASGGGSSAGGGGDDGPPSPPAQQCAICVAAAADAAFASCGHACCSGCADRLVRKGLFKLAVQLQTDATAGGARLGARARHGRSRSRARSVGRLVSSQPPQQLQRRGTHEAGATAVAGPRSRDARDGGATAGAPQSSATRIRVTRGLSPASSPAAAAAALHDRRARAARAMQPPRSASVPAAAPGAARVAINETKPPRVRAVIRVDDSRTEGGAFGSLSNPMFRPSGGSSRDGGAAASRAVSSTASAPCSPSGAAGGGVGSRTSRTALLQDEGDGDDGFYVVPSTAASRRALGEGGAGNDAAAGGVGRIGPSPALTSVRVAAFGSSRASRTATDGLYAAALGAPTPSTSRQEAAAPQLPGAAAASSSAEDPRGSVAAAAGTGIPASSTVAGAHSGCAADASQLGRRRSSFAALAAAALPPAVLRRWPRCPFCREPVSHVVRVGQLSVLQQGAGGGSGGDGLGGNTVTAAARRLPVVVAEVTPL